MKRPIYALKSDFRFDRGRGGCFAFAWALYCEDEGANLDFDGDQEVKGSFAIAAKIQIKEGVGRGKFDFINFGFCGFG